MSRQALKHAANPLPESRRGSVESVDSLCQLVSRQMKLPVAGACRTLPETGTHPRRSCVIVSDEASGVPAIVLRAARQVTDESVVRCHPCWYLISHPESDTLAELFTQPTQQFVQKAFGDFFSGGPASSNNRVVLNYGGASNNSRCSAENTDRDTAWSALPASIQLLPPGRRSLRSADLSKAFHHFNQAGRRETQRFPGLPQDTMNRRDDSGPRTKNHPHFQLTSLLANSRHTGASPGKPPSLHNPSPETRPRA